MQFQWNTALTVANAFIVINAMDPTIPVKVLTDGSFSLRENGNGKDLIALGLQNSSSVIHQRWWTTT
jgi:hypothetical protein